LNVSRTTVRSRIEKLQQNGTILGFSVVLKQDAQDDAVRGMMMICVEGRGTDRVIRQINGMPEVRALHSTNGKWDLIAEIGTETLDQLDSALNKIRKVEGVVSSETNLLLSTKKTG
jgi:DNA-binding Lrp family transcriptional regulator